MNKIKQYKNGDERQSYQGDISIIRIEKADCDFLPLPKDGVIVGHSESGNNHRVMVKDRESDIKFGQNAEGYFIRVDRGSAIIVHEKENGHAPQTLTQGVHFIGKQYEYSDFEDRKVID